MNIVDQNIRGMILIPAYNEAISIGEVVQDAINIGGFNVLVIDDASTDATAATAVAAGALLLPLTSNLGSWGAIQAGIRYAFEVGMDFVVTMDADGQHRAAYVPCLIAPIRNDIADVIIGSDIKRASILKLLTWQLFRVISDLDVIDLTSGFRVYNRNAMQVLISSQATLLDYQDIGVLLLLRDAGLRFMEVGVEMCPRKYGHSRIFSSWLQIGRYLAVTTLLCVGKWRRSRSTIFIF